MVESWRCQNGLSKGVGLFTYVFRVIKQITLGLGLLEFVSMIKCKQNIHWSQNSVGMA